MRIRWLTMLVLLVGVGAAAQTRYISDRTIIELRRGPGTEFVIQRNLEAGEQVEVLEQNQEAGYSRVRVADQGSEGWILTRYLIAEPIARERLIVAERSLAAARERVAALETQVNQLTTDLTSARRDLEQTRTSHGTVSKELADIRTAAANVVETRDENTRLQQRLTERDREVADLTADNARLAGRNHQNWFIIGAAVLLAGVVVGLVAPSLRRKRRSDW